MASKFAKSVLAFAVAVVVGGVARAQDDAFTQGVTLMRLGQKEAALAKFQEVLASDPSNEQALALYRSMDQDVWLMLLSEQGDIGLIAKSILERAKLERVERSRDQAAIDDLVALACGADTDAGARRDAVQKLAAHHGEFAVPALLAHLANPDDDNGQVRAIYALTQIGHTAVLPLVAALGHSSDTARLNAASALLHIGDDRAAPAMARLAQHDTHEPVRMVAQKFLAKKGLTRSAADLYRDQAMAYLTKGVASGAMSDVVWTLQDDKLVSMDVPAGTYGLELAKAAAHAAVEADPTNEACRSLLAQTYLAQANVIEASVAQNPDSELKQLEPIVGELKMTALAAGPAVLGRALSDAQRDGLVPVAVGAIEALAMADGKGSAALQAALDSTDSRISYAAAMALVRLSGGRDVPQAEKVVNLLASAVAERSIRMIQVIDSNPETRRAATEASVGGTRIWVEPTAVRGMSAILGNPQVDVVVINEILPDRAPEDVIRLVRKDPRTANAKVLVMAKDVEKAGERFGSLADAVIAGPVTGDSLTAAVDAALDGVPVDPRNARAEQIAIGASAALEAMAGSGSIQGALASLAGQLGRDDAVAVPAARALGQGGSQAQIGALLEAVEGSGSLDLKVAAAEAIGMILGRGAATPDGLVQALSKHLGAEVDMRLRTAVAIALGKARLSDQEKAQLLESLRKVGAKAEG